MAKVQCPHCESVFRVRPEHFDFGAPQFKCSACQQLFMGELLDDSVKSPKKRKQTPAYGQVDDLFGSQGNTQGDTQTSPGKQRVADRDLFDQGTAQKDKIKQERIDQDAVDGTSAALKESSRLSAQRRAATQRAAKPESQATNAPLFAGESSFTESVAETSVESSDDEDYFTKRRPTLPPIKKLVAGLGQTSLVLVVLLLVMVLGYQMWLKPFKAISQNQTGYETLNRVYAPLVGALADTPVALPEPTQSRGLSIASVNARPADTPEGGSALVVTFFSQAVTPQPLPWLELTLTDENEATVARRHLNPRDYLFGLDTSAIIKPREAKRLTLNFDTFPAAATGYELRILTMPPVELTQ